MRAWQTAFILFLCIGLFPAAPGGVAEVRAAESYVSGFGSTAETEDPLDDRGRPRYKPGELLMVFTSRASESAIAALHEQAGATVVARRPARRLHRVRFNSSAAALNAMRRYREAPIVSHVERHALRYPQAEPNDAFYDQQWALERIAAPAAWEFTSGSREVVVAVIDSGVDYSHPDLAANIWVNEVERDGAGGQDDDGNGCVDDLVGWDFAGAFNTGADPDADPFDGAASGHGTHVAGTIAAVGNNGEGIAGLCWKARLMALKVKADDSEYFETYDIIQALDYAVQNGARIVNCSFGGTEFSELEKQAFQRVRQAGILTVCAAGNSGFDLDSEPVYPASYDVDNIIVVAAGTRTDALAAFSNWGSLSVDVMAPGDAICSTVPGAYYTEASVATFEAAYSGIGMLFAGTTGTAGISGELAICGEGYPQEFPTGRQGYVALIWRSDPSAGFYFSQKVSNAREAGAAAAVIANNRVDDLDWTGGTLGAPDNWLPAITVSRAVGKALTPLAGRTVTVVNRLVDTSGAYSNKQGTSMAVPHVSGLAGLIWSRDAGLDYRRVKSAILDGVDLLDGLVGKMVSGGRINAHRSLCLAAHVSGDLSCNGRVGLEDAVIAGRLLTGQDSFACRRCLTAGTDPVPDGAVSPADLAAILQMLAGLQEIRPD